jgi:glutamate carboxypeptidase
VVLLNAAEETIAADFSELCLERLVGPTLACLVFEMGHLDHQHGLVVVARKGMALFRVVARGRAAHAGSAHSRGASAVVQLARVIQHIDSLTDYERKLTFNVGTVAGGTVLNRVPHYAAASGEMRAFYPAVYNQGLSSLLALSEQVSVRSPEDGYPCSIEVKILNETPPWPRNQATDHLLSMWQAAGQKLSLAVAPQERGGLSDGNATWPYIPTLDGLGPSGGNAHCSEHSPDGGKEQEYVSPLSFVPKALLNIVGILNLINQPVETDR